MKNGIYIIAEAGVNHNGSIEMAVQLIDAAVYSGADAVKFQTFRADDLVCRYAEKAEYQKLLTEDEESQYAMLKRLELNSENHRVLHQYCSEKKIQLLSSPFDLKSIDLLRDLGLNIIKIPSGEITNLPYLEKIGRFNCEIILSTGMADDNEIAQALKVLTEAGTDLSQITLLHCTTAYPAPFEDVNLLAMQGMKRRFRVDVGYSDHTKGYEVAIAAAALGAKVIEKHFTLDRNLPGPDHQASLEPHELHALVHSIRNVEMALGSSDKKVTPSDKRNRDRVRKSIVAVCDIKKGEVFSERNLGVKRPGTGLSPMLWYDLIGKKAPCDFAKDTIISEP